MVSVTEKLKKKKGFSGMPQEEGDFSKLFIIATPMVYKAFFCGILFQIFQFKCLHNETLPKHNGFLSFFTK